MSKSVDLAFKGENPNWIDGVKTTYDAPIAVFTYDTTISQNGIFLPIKDMDPNYKDIEIRVLGEPIDKYMEDIKRGDISDIGKSLELPSKNRVSSIDLRGDNPRAFEEQKNYNVIVKAKFASTSHPVDNRIKSNETFIDVPYINFKAIGITNTSNFFRNAPNFIGDSNMNEWDVSNVKDMSYMFDGAKKFNQDIGGWDTSNVVHMNSMFHRADKFNQDIGNWDTSNVTYMSYMFYDSASFNQDISKWDVSNVVAMNDMFNGASLFNQDISSWNVERVINNDRMFYNTPSFNPTFNPFN